MKENRKKRNNFRETLEKYLSIKGLDIVILLNDGGEIELFKNRTLIDDTIITVDTNNREHRIPIAHIKSVDLYAA